MSDEKLIRKKERYITERISAKGTHSLEICIRLKGCPAYRKSIRIDEFSTPSEALATAVSLRDETLAKLRAGKKVTGFKTVRQVYIDSYDILPVSIKTRRRHDIYFRMAFEPYAETPIDKITAADIQKCLNKYAETHTRKETSKLLAVWRRLYKVCAMEDMALADKSVSVELPKGIQAKHRPKEIKREDLETFLEALLNYNAGSVSGSYNSQSVYYAIRIMQFLGLRPAETFALMKEDINLIENTITINKAAHSTVTSLLEISNTKTEESARVVPIPAQLRPILIECLAWSRNDILLAKYNGNLWEITEVDTMIGNVRRKCGIYFTLYQLRHQFSTDLLRAGTPLPTVRDLMGHSSESMTLDYAVSDKEDRQKAVDDRKFS